MTITKVISMLDMETLALVPRSYILSIAIDTIYTDDEFKQLDRGNIKVYLSKEGQTYRTIDSRTVKWWEDNTRKMEEEAFILYNDFNYPERDKFELGLGKIYSYLSDIASYNFDSHYLLSKGSDFDIPILVDALNTSMYLPLDKIISYKNKRCFRTIQASYDKHELYKPQGTFLKHDALVDAQYQNDWLMNIINKFGGSVL